MERINEQPEIENAGNLPAAAIESRRDEEKLREEHSRFLCDSMPAICHSIDLSGRIVAVSDQWLEKFGYQRYEVIGHRSVEFLTEKSRAYAESITLPEFWSVGSARDIPYQFVRKNGQIVDVLLSAVAEPDAEGKYHRTLAILRDVSERRRLAEREGEMEDQTLPRRYYGLTWRELDILDLLAEGKTDKQIAVGLGIRSLTASKHVGNILEKMNAESRTEAAVRAIRDGVIR